MINHVFTKEEKLFQNPETHQLNFTKFIRISMSTKTIHAQFISEHISFSNFYPKALTFT